MIKKNKYKKLKYKKKLLKSLKQIFELNQIDFSKIYNNLPSCDICKTKKIRIGDNK